MRKKEEVVRLLTAEKEELERIITVVSRRLGNAPEGVVRIAKLGNCKNTSSTRHRKQYDPMLFYRVSSWISGCRDDMIKQMFPDGAYIFGRIPEERIVR